MWHELLDTLYVSSLQPCLQVRVREEVGLRQPLPEVDVGRLALDVVRLPLEDDRLLQLAQRVHLVVNSIEFQVSTDCSIEMLRFHFLVESEPELEPWEGELELEPYGT